MKTECFTNYTSEDFICDKDFRALVQDPNEAEKLKDLIESLPEKRYEINLAIEIIRGLHVTKFIQSNARKKELWQQVVTKPKKRIELTFIKYAAAILLLIGTGSVFYFFNKKEMKSELAVENDNLNEMFTSNQNDALLVLSNGKTIAINSKESTVKYSNDGSKVNINDSEEIQQSVNDAGLNKMIVPYGKRSTITLSDGTKVWLNSGSTLIFPAVLGKKSREVQLIGEGFFDVIHNIKNPFYVNTDAFKVKVYGTKFDIQSYKLDNASTVVLVEGKISMKSNEDISEKEVFLKPNQRASILDGTRKIEVDNIENTDEYTSWTEGYLSFSDEDITHLLKQVSRYYNVDISIVGAEKVDKIFGKLDLKDNLENVLDGIAFISNTKYKKIGNKYEFYQ